MLSSFKGIDDLTTFTSPHPGDSMPFQPPVEISNTPTSNVLELDQLDNSDVLGTSLSAANSGDALVQEDIRNQIAPRSSDFSYSCEENSLAMVRACSMPKKDTDIILANLSDFLDEVHASEYGAPDALAERTASSPDRDVQDSIYADQKFTDEEGSELPSSSPHAVQPLLSSDSLDCPTVILLPSPCSSPALISCSAPNFPSSQIVDDNQAASCGEVDVDILELDRSADSRHLHYDISSPCPVQSKPLSFLWLPKKTVSSSPPKHLTKTQDSPDSPGGAWFGDSLIATQVLSQDVGIDPVENGGLVSSSSLPEEKSSNSVPQREPLSSFDESEQEDVFQPLSSSPAKASGAYPSSPVDQDSIDTLDPLHVPLPSSSPPMTSSSPPSSSPPTSPFTSPLTFWHPSPSSLSEDRTNGALQDNDINPFIINDGELTDVTNGMHWGTHRGFSPKTDESARTRPPTDRIQTHESQCRHDGVVPLKTFPEKIIQRDSNDQPTFYQDSDCIISQKSSESLHATQMSLPPQPKRPTVAAQKLQYIKLTRPFRSPIVTDNKSIPNPFFLPKNPKDPRRTLHQEAEEKENPQSTAITHAESTETKDPKIKYRTKRAASHFKSPLAAGSEQPAPLVRLTPTIQALERKVQILKRAVKVKAEMSEDVLERLVRKWTEAGREVAWEVWDLVKDNAATDDWRENRGGSYERKRPFEDGWGWDDRGDQKKLKAEEQERHWGWSVVPIRPEEGAEVTTADSECDAVRENSFGEHPHGTLGMMLKQLGISPETLGWNGDEELFVD